MASASARRPFVLGLTGSIGMGKSTVAGAAALQRLATSERRGAHGTLMPGAAAMFRELGVPVLDADQARATGSWGRGHAERV